MPARAYFSLCDGAVPVVRRRKRSGAGGQARSAALWVDFDGVTRKPGDGSALPLRIHLAKPSLIVP